MQNTSQKCDIWREFEEGEGCHHACVRASLAEAFAGHASEVYSHTLDLQVVPCKTNQTADVRSPI